MLRQLVVWGLVFAGTPALAACPSQSALGGKQYSSVIELYSADQQLLDVCVLRGAFGRVGISFSGSGHCTTTPRGAVAFSNTVTFANGGFDASACVARFTGTTRIPGDVPASLSGTVTFSLNGQAYDLVGILPAVGIRIVERGVLQ